MKKIKSPCTGNCTASSLGDEICKGCKRTFDEVRLWNALDEQQKQQVIKRIKNESNPR
jgi:predicted Fe-S protein YdhL (DUF1289 family)